MTFHYNVSGEARKALVKAMGEILERKPVYKFMPTKNYEVGSYTIDPNGDVSFDDRTDSEEVEMLVEALLERGFKPENAPEYKQPGGTEEAPDDAPTTEFVVSIPTEGFDVHSFGRLHTLVAAKRTLLQKALGTELLPVQVLEDRIEFPWFHGEIDADHALAYAELVSRICAMAKNAKRVTAKPYTGHPALSREDNATLICPECGTREALAAMGLADDEVESILDVIRKHSAL